jgi:predicted acyl esterase
VFAYLEDVSPDGRVTYVTEGQLRAINRRLAEPAALPYDPGPAPHSFYRADAMPVVPGEWFTISFKLHSVAALVKKGHRVRLAIAGADADTFRSLPGQPGQFDIERGAPEPSFISLPLRPWQGAAPPEALGDPAGQTGGRLVDLFLYGLL